MDTGPSSPSDTTNSSTDADGIHRIAAKALEQVRHDSERHIRHARDKAAKQIARMSTSSATFDPGGLIGQLNHLGITREEAVDRVIPDAARILGAAWVADEMTFADVTLGSNRLLDLTQNLEADWAPVRTRRDKSFSLVVMTPPGEQHILGPITVTAQLRRLGHSAKLMLGPSLQDLISFLNENTCHAVLISLGSRVLLDTLGPVLEGVNTQSQRCPKVILGGAFLSTAEQCDVIKKFTGVYLVTNDLDLALDGLGLSISAHEWMAAE